MQVLENLWRASLQVFFDCYGILNLVNTEPLLNFLHLTLDSIWETVLQRQYLQKQERWWKCHSTLVLNIFWSMFPGVIYFFPLISFVIFSLIEEGFWWISCLFICLLVFSNCALELFTFIAEREHHSFLGGHLIATCSAGLEEFSRFFRKMPCLSLMLILCFQETKWRSASHHCSIT